MIAFTPVQINNSNQTWMKAVKLATSVCLLYQNPLFESFWARPWIVLYVGKLIIHLKVCCIGRNMPLDFENQNKVAF